MIPTDDENPGAPFTLTKWYFDCVASDGRVVIGYWASLAWRRLAFTWQTVVLHQPGEPPLRRSSLAAAPPPCVGGAILWRAPALECVFEVCPTQPAIEARLLDDGTGVIEWRAEAPAAEVRVELHGSAPVQGPGYAERLRITVPPWRLPIRELRWGRWIGDVPDRSVVWIDWRGTSPRTWVFVDGIRLSAAEVSDDGVSAPDLHLVIDERRLLEEMAFSQIAAAIPALGAMVPASILALRQTRWCSHGALHQGDAAARHGRAIHEVVVF